MPHSKVQTQGKSEVSASSPLLHCIRSWWPGCWVQALDVCPHPVALAALAALAHLVTALLHAQSLKPSALMRALLSPTETAVPARPRDKRVARALDRPWLTPAWLTPLLVRAVLTLLPPEESAGEGDTDTKEVTAALDSVRYGPWEAFTLGLVWRGRVIPVAWQVLASPWPVLQSRIEYPSRWATSSAPRTMPGQYGFVMLGTRTPTVRLRWLRRLLASPLG